ncbi:MAG: serine/threonine-protein kinase [Sandaracinaceae bacterium]
MEMLDGQELAELVDDGPLPIGRAVRILLPVCSALAAAHEAGIVHRDLKPANIFLVHREDGSDFPKVLDFGVSKAGLDDNALTKTGTAIGTPAYMSPEQAQGSRASTIGRTSTRSAPSCSSC